jgi:hypothetical protein
LALEQPPAATEELAASAAGRLIEIAAGTDAARTYGSFRGRLSTSHPDRHHVLAAPAQRHQDHQETTEEHRIRTECSLDHSLPSICRPLIASCPESEGRLRNPAERDRRIRLNVTSLSGEHDRFVRLNVTDFD